jgi:aspartyl-tRNA(Asn)/glutamyl-tRNA(Gln) amidotransferase subunit C
MISKEEIKKLADLARIDTGEEEQEKLASEMDAILDYVGQVNSVIGDTKEGSEIRSLHNVMRNDENPTEPETYNKELIAEFPKSENGYLKVKKIL